MEPNILAPLPTRVAPSAPGWTPQADETLEGARGEAEPAGAKAPVADVRRMPVARDGALTTARSAVIGRPHAHGNGNGTATWPGLTPGSRAGLARIVPAYEAPAESGLYLRVGKRLLDVAGALIGLLLTSPLLLLAAILIKLESRGPVVYKSLRIGRGARPFTFFKLRSMMDGADQHRHTLSHLNESDGPVFKMARDPRVTHIGRLLRVTSIDEIPQLWNVLRGEMSLVGPRPPIAEEVVRYEPWQLRRLDVLPGITCLWQISGRSRIGFQEWMRLDLEYIKHRSFWLDLKILIRTVPAVLSREGAY